MAAEGRAIGGSAMLRLNDVSGLKKENAELAVLSGYLPQQLSPTELDALIDEAIASSAAASIKDMGKVMNLIKARAQGRADMVAVGVRIKARLSPAG